MDSSTMLDNMVKTIVAVTSPLKVVLFGSQAQGTSRSDSDYDFLIIENQPFTNGRSRRKETAAVWQALMPYPVAKDILIYSTDDILRLQGYPQHVVNTALHSGKTVYEREP